VEGFIDEYDEDVEYKMEGQEAKRIMTMVTPRTA